MSKSKRSKRTTTQTLLWLLSLFLIGSMVISLFVVAFPGVSGSPRSPEPTATDTPIPPTLTPTPTQPPASPGTTPIAGPELPTATAAP